MQWLAELCVKRPVFATVLILSLTVVGAFSFIQLGVDRYPKVDIPTILITTVQPGAAPEQIETEVTDKIEQAVNTISGIDELRSTSSEGVSIVTVGFLLEKDGDIAAQEVRDKVNGILSQLPRTIEQPRVDRFDPDAAPVLSLALTSKRPVREITEYADKVIRRQLESLEGVGQVVVIGGRSRQINITLDADRLRAHNVTVTDVVARAEPAERGDPRRPHGPGPAVRDAPHARPRPERRRVQRHRGEGEPDPPGQNRRRRAGRRRHGRRRHDREHRRHGHGAAERPAAVRHEHRRGRQEHQGAHRRNQEGAAARLRSAHRPRHVGVHRSVDQQRRGTPHRGVHPGGARRAAVPHEPALDAHLRHRHPDVDHRHVRPDLVHGLHARHPDDAGADPVGRHRDRRRDRGAGEHLPLHRGEGRGPVPGGDRRHQGDRPRRAGDHAVARRRSSSPSPSWAASSAGS